MISKEELQEYFENSDKIYSAHNDLIDEFLGSMEEDARSFCLIYLIAAMSLFSMKGSSSAFKRYITKYSPSYIAMAESWEYGWKHVINEYNANLRCMLLFEEFMEQFRKDPENMGQKKEAIFIFLEKYCDA